MCDIIHGFSTGKGPISSIHDATFQPEIVVGLIVDNIASIAQSNIRPFANTADTGPLAWIY